MTTTQPVSSGARAELPSPTPHRRLPRPSSAHLLLTVTALLAGLLNYAVLRSADQRVPVVVAARAVAPGEVVNSGIFSFTEVRADDATLALLLAKEQVDEVNGWVVVAPLARGDLVRRSDLRRPAAPDGRRAMSLPVDPAHAAGGALSVGDNVDVISVDGGQARYIVTAATVLNVSRNDGPGALGAARLTVTLAVDEAAALRLAAALQGQGLELLRSTGAGAPQPSVEANGRSSEGS